ncbi:hemerythrin domain-containing protein [Sphingomonas sp. UYP23]
MLDKLLSDHERMRSLGDEVRACLTSLTPDPVRMETARWQLSRLSMQHFAADERLVLVPLETRGSSAAAKLAARFRKDLEKFYEWYRNHMERWTGTAIERDPTGFGGALDEILAWQKDRLKREERELYPLLATLRTEASPPPARNWAANAWDIHASIHKRRSGE